jgi:hypothetical protein
MLKINNTSINNTSNVDQIGGRWKPRALKNLKTRGYSTEKGDCPGNDIEQTTNLPYQGCARRCRIIQNVIDSIIMIMI